VYQATDGRPARMMRNGRPINNNFEPQERLFFRLPPDIDIGPDDKPDASCIKYPDMSVNREKESEPDDVIFGFSGWGVAAFMVADVPPPLKSEGGPEFTYKVEHVPLENNYAHSEVRTYKDGVHSRKVKMPETVKKRYRTLLMKGVRVLRRPIP
jgi:hypothetical protein